MRRAHGRRLRAAVALLQQTFAAAWVTLSCGTSDDREGRICARSRVETVLSPGSTPADPGQDPGFQREVAGGNKLLCRVGALEALLASKTARRTVQKNRKELA